MAIANRPYGKVLKGHKTPYGAMVGVSEELRNVYYTYGYLRDESMPPLPCPPHEDEPYICPEEELFKKQMVDIVAAQLDTLSPRASKVLRLRFGFGFSYDMTLEEIGTTFDVTRERIRQIEAKALRNLKHPSRSDILRQLIEPESTVEREQKEKEALEEWRRQRTALFEMRKAAAAKRELETRRKLKRDIATAYMRNDTRWMEFFKEKEPELYAQLEERIKAVTEKYDTAD